MLTSEVAVSKYRHSICIHWIASGGYYGFSFVPPLQCVERFNSYCLASEVRHPSEVRHLHFMAILDNFYCPVMAYLYTLPLKEAIPFL